MRTLATAPAIAFVAIATACGGTGTRNSDQRSGHDANEPTNSVTAQPQATRTALVGCLRGGGQAGSYTLVVTGDAPDRAGTGTSGSSTSGRPAPASSSTTGAGGDAVRNSPPIGGGATPLTSRLIAAGTRANDARQNVDRQVSVVGVIEDNATAGGTGDAASSAPMRGATRPASGDGTHTIRASSITKIADNCSTSE